MFVCFLITYTIFTDVTGYILIQLSWDESLYRFYINLIAGLFRGLHVCNLRIVLEIIDFPQLCWENLFILV